MLILDFHIVQYHIDLKGITFSSFLVAAAPVDNITGLYYSS